MPEHWITHRRGGWTVRSRQEGHSPLRRTVAAGLCLAMLAGALGSLLLGLDSGLVKDDFVSSPGQRRGWTPDELSRPPIQVDLRPALGGAGR